MYFSPNYSNLVELARYGYSVSPRGIATHETNYPVVLHIRPGVNLARPGMNVRLAVFEAMTIVGGIFDLGLLAKTAPHARLDLYAKQSDYGPRLKKGLAKASTLLRLDPDTRRAVALVDRPEDTATDNEPCATSVQFRIRNDELLTHVNMRSWDMYLGMPYDIITFGILAQLVAHNVGVPNGILTMFATSLHYYESDESNLQFVGENHKQLRIVPEDWPHAWDNIVYQAEQIAKSTPWETTLPPGIVWVP